PDARPQAGVVSLRLQFFLHRAAFAATLKGDAHLPGLPAQGASLWASPRQIGLKGRTNPDDIFGMKLAYALRIS
ncbi:MAG: hypothetical protein ACREXG_11100, partial [Polaromonas sp.]